MPTHRTLPRLPKQTLNPLPLQTLPDTTTPIHFPSALKHLPCGPSRETDSVDGLVTRFQKVKLRPPSPPPPPPPEINAKLDGARRECDADDCSRKSAPNFDGHTYYCHGHGHKIQKEWRYQCVGTKKRSIDRCNNYSYRILHTDVDERTYRCQYHIHNESGHLFRTQTSRSTSHDITIKLSRRHRRDVYRLLISGQQFDSMYTYFSIFLDLFLGRGYSRP